MTRGKGCEGFIVKRFLMRVLASATLGACAVNAASADTLRYDGAFFPPYSGAFTITDGDPYRAPVSLYAGAFKMTDTSGTTVPAGTSFMAWCVDIYHYISPSTSYTLTSGADFYSGAPYKVTDLERLASFVFDSSTALLTNAAWGASNVQAAAFQLATWEITNDKAGSGSYDVNSGDFRVTSGSTTVRNLANSWLAVVNAGTYGINQQVSVWRQDNANTTQDLAVFAPIPEPEIYAMMGIGLALMGFVARRRRQQFDA